MLWKHVFFLFFLFVFLLFKGTEPEGLGAASYVCVRVRHTSPGECYWDP
jgi:hypothetical protein